MEIAFVNRAAELKELDAAVLDSSTLKQVRKETGSARRSSAAKTTKGG
jgi:hypothetical protein